MTDKVYVSSLSRFKIHGVQVCLLALESFTCSLFFIFSGRYTVCAFFPKMSEMCLIDWLVFCEEQCFCACCYSKRAPTMSYKYNLRQLCQVIDSLVHW